MIQMYFDFELNRHQNQRDYSDNLACECYIHNRNLWEKMLFVTTKTILGIGKFLLIGDLYA